MRPAAQLLADVSEFMTLGAGDVLMLGCDVGRPLASAGDRIEIARPAWAPCETPSWRRRMKHARIVHEGAMHDAAERDGQLLLDDGRWCPSTR